MPTKEEKEKLISYIKKYKTIFGIDNKLFEENNACFSEQIIQSAKQNGLPTKQSLPLTLKWMQEGLSSYIQELQNSTTTASFQFVTYFQQILEAFSLPDTALKSKQDLYKYLLKQTLEKPDKPLVIPSGYKGHSITFVIYKDTLICINRGKFILNNQESAASWGSILNSQVTKNTDQEYGLWWTKITSPAQIPGLISHLLTGITFPNTTDSKTTEPEFMNNLMQLLLNKQYDKITINTDATHPVAKQKFHNCAWANKKPIILAVLTLLGKHQNIPSEKTLKEYKKCTTFLRLREIDKIIEDATKEGLISSAAKAMLLAIIIKLTSKLKIAEKKSARLEELLAKIKEKLVNNNLYNDIFQKLPETAKNQITNVNLNRMNLAGVYELLVQELDRMPTHRAPEATVGRRNSKDYPPYRKTNFPNKFRKIVKSQRLYKRGNP